MFTKRATGEPWQIQALEQNYFNCNEFTVPVGTGDIVLFPSNLIHSVPQTDHEHTRVSLAFNSFWEGELGFVQGEIDGINFLRVNTPSQTR
jgi:ectoine hydroxylase-related dioxygenase (phytanoyl-CoA dioxygenase family)